MKCKNCIHYKPNNGYKYGDCNKITAMSETEIGLKLNPERVFYPNNGWKNDYNKPAYVLDENSSVYLDGIIWHNGGGYDTMSVGENFGCIHFDNGTTNKFKELEERILWLEQRMTDAENSIEPEYT
jgi:hypothetical protein